MRANRPEQMWDHVAVGGPDECWERQGRRTSLGYGQFSVAGKDRGPHRIVMEILGHRLSGADVVMHLCDNPPCVNPAHLRVGTQAENMLDKVSKGRQMRGEAHVGAKLTDWQISEVRDAAIGGESQRSIARRYGIAQSHVWRIVNRLSRVS